MIGRQAFAALGGPLLVCSLIGTAAAQKFNHNSYLGKAPPELVSQRSHWLGWRETVTLDRLKGKVVWLQFCKQNRTTEEQQAVERMPTLLKPQVGPVVRT